MRWCRLYFIEDWARNNVFRMAADLIVKENKQYTNDTI